MRLDQTELRNYYRGTYKKMKKEVKAAKKATKAAKNKYKSSSRT